MNQPQHLHLSNVSLVAPHLCATSTLIWVPELSENVRSGRVWCVLCEKPYPVLGTSRSALRGHRASVFLGEDSFLSCPVTTGFHIFLKLDLWKESLKLRREENRGKERSVSHLKRGRGKIIH